MDIYLMIGQSNMGGAAGPRHDDNPITGCKLLNSSDTWETAQESFNRYSSIGGSNVYMGPHWSFATRMLELDPATEIGIIANAMSGSMIYEWERGSYYYTEAVRRVRAGRAASPGSQIRGIIWHQGESELEGEYGLYMGRLTQLINDFRKDIHPHNAVKFVAGQVPDYVFERRKDMTPLNTALLDLPNQAVNTAVALNTGWTQMADETHFDTPTQLAMGIRYADAIHTL